ncbi:MAG: DUF488 domain-containing protein [Chloroflexi bacterium]|nr:MAG: DUF488 domain-containing protein [Chloroflexota bacterium]RLC96792.1 MAG: DUF488 domain-containing protein [Chloroflexota bacterium]
MERAVTTTSRWMMVRSAAEGSGQCYHDEQVPDGDRSGELLAGATRLVYTVGTSTRSADEFVSLLKGLGVEAVVDVRRFPSSRFEHFRREEMATSLPKVGLGYHYLGDSLGGYRTGGYQAFSGSEEFRRGLDELERIAAERRTAVVCAERLPWRCHRRFIGDGLRERGWQVVHVIDEKRTWSPAE